MNSYLATISYIAAHLNQLIASSCQICQIMKRMTGGRSRLRLLAHLLTPIDIQKDPNTMILRKTLISRRNTMILQAKIRRLLYQKFKNSTEYMTTYRILITPHPRPPRNTQLQYRSDLMCLETHGLRMMHKETFSPQLFQV